MLIEAEAGRGEQSTMVGECEAGDAPRKTPFLVKNTRRCARSRPHPTTSPAVCTVHHASVHDTRRGPGHGRDVQPNVGPKARPFLEPQKTQPSSAWYAHERASQPGSRLSRTSPATNLHGTDEQIASSTGASLTYPTAMCLSAVCGEYPGLRTTGNRREAAAHPFVPRSSTSTS